MKGPQPGIGLGSNSGSSSGSSRVIYGGVVSASVNPMLPGWGSPPAEATVLGTVTDEFVDAPQNIPAGEYRGTIVKQIAANFIDLTYTTLSGRVYKKLMFLDNGQQNSAWEEVGTSAKEAIWTLKNNSTTTAATTTGPAKFQANMSLFNAVETDFLGDLNIGSGSDFEFTVGVPRAFEIQMHGAIEDAANATQKIAIALYDSATNDHMTGSMQILSPASTWSSANEYTFNCIGFARLDPNNTVSLQVMVDANAALVLKECIVVLKPIES
ncbi:primase/helicase [Vibrio phage VPMS1]|uniref:primase/helicase n=1 Tax=Vibrio phage VPMS1 TaxID=1233488 RepID=UPI0003586893|nr:primase/helicase [Vibrio phage VPMS1]AFV51093.1 primase/helicase [Vibrio phage VPMS1]